jgi:hypothetical protein
MMRPSEPAALLGIRLTTYADLEKIVTAFARGDLNLLILLGGPGLGKSRVVYQATAGQACWVGGNTSPFGLYCQLWRNQHRTVVLDDLDGLYASGDGIRLLKCLTQTEPQKSVSWYTDAATLAREQIPRQFRTTSRVAIITNEWKTLNRNVAALEDRGHVVRFEPSPLEVHERTASWFWDQEVFDFLGERLHLVRGPSMRHYVAAWSRPTNYDVRAMLPGLMPPPDPSIRQRLVRVARCRPKKSRVLVAGRAAPACPGLPRGSLAHC